LIGKARTQSGAEKLLQTELLGTLRASGFIETSSGKRLKATELNLGRQFNPSKRDSSRIVQNRSFRLGTRSEVKEIQRSKRKRGFF